jgi:hypothetical protein
MKNLHETCNFGLDSTTHLPGILNLTAFLPVPLPWPKTKVFGQGVKTHESRLLRAGTKFFDRLSGVLRPFPKNPCILRFDLLRISH